MCKVNTATFVNTAHTLLSSTTMFIKVTPYWQHINYITKHEFPR